MQQFTTQKPHLNRCPEAAWQSLTFTRPSYQEFYPRFWWQRGEETNEQEGVTLVAQDQRQS